MQNNIFPQANGYENIL